MARSAERNVAVHGRVATHAPRAVQPCPPVCVTSGRRASARALPASARSHLRLRCQFHSGNGSRNVVSVAYQLRRVRPDARCRRARTRGSAAPSPRRRRRRPHRCGCARSPVFASSSSYPGRRRARSAHVAADPPVGAVELAGEEAREEPALSQRDDLLVQDVGVALDAGRRVRTSPAAGRVRRRRRRAPSPPSSRRARGRGCRSRRRR